MHTPPSALSAPGDPTASAIARAGAVLGRAFFADPLTTRVQPSEAARRRGLPVVYTACLRHAARAGGVVILPEETGALGWVPLSLMKIGLTDIFASGFVSIPLYLGPIATLRLSSHDAWCDRQLIARAPKEAAYIYVVGVEPELAGRGLGALLMREALAHIAPRHAHCVLRTEQPRNVRFYEKLGFTCVEHFLVPTSGVPTWFFSKELA